MFLIRQRYKFETNSQLRRSQGGSVSIVSDTSKIQIWNQFTTGILDHIPKVYCFWYVKDTNLKPIHNDGLTISLNPIIVSDTSKIQIWNQFTTKIWQEKNLTKLFLIRQRYKFETNSQLVRKHGGGKRDCFWYVKDTNLKPIHNCFRNVEFHKIIVSDTSKIQIWNQFTTEKPPFQITQVLFLIRQRYKFETNSQPQQIKSFKYLDCFWYVKDTNLKPIHNYDTMIVEQLLIVSDTSKIQIWNQFTTYIHLLFHRHYCFWYVKDTNLKPIHNIWRKYSIICGIVSDTSKIQIWNQFTTWGERNNLAQLLFLIRQRYKFETNSQLIIKGCLCFLIVSDTSKIQIWNQFTTCTGPSLRSLTLFLIRQRYKFETNSQREGCGWKGNDNCFWYVKDTNLKPIHNDKLYYFDFSKIVSDTSKIQIWNQFTTLQPEFQLVSTLFLIRQRYKFETNSQLSFWLPHPASYCFWYVKDTNLKPIHNTSASVVFVFPIVSDTSKIQIWNQFTTQEIK